MSGLNWTKRPKATEQANPTEKKYWQGGGMKPPQARPQTEREKDEAFYRDWAAQMRGE
jgi:hypothetical protein